MLIHALTAYLIAFALSWWPSIAHHRYQDREMRAIAEEVAEAGGTPMEDLRLMNIAAMESNFDRKAIGRHGERGAWQIMPPAREYGAREALRRMREQGMSEEVDRTARAIYEDLQRHPVALNTLRAGKLAMEVGAVTATIATLGLAHIVLGVVLGSLAPPA